MSEMQTKPEKIRVYLLWVILWLVAISTACRRDWQVQVGDGSQESQVVQASQWDQWQEYEVKDGGISKIPVERVLADLGYQLIERVELTTLDGMSRTFEWEQVAADAWWQAGGQIFIDGESLQVVSILIQPPLSFFQVNASILDIAPTTAAILGIPAPAQAVGQPLITEKAERVALIFLDGFGYQRFMQAYEDGLVPFLGSLAPPLLALTTYPPVTQVSSASVLTGAPPSVHGVNARGVRKTDIQTLFDIASRHGLNVAAVEGESLSFEMRNASFKLSGDRNGDGRTDDEVLANALSVLQAGQPDLFWVHFHGIDDAGHSYSPGASQEQQVVRHVDQAVELLVSSLEPGTAVILFADHGQHAIGDGREGNHAHLIEADMLISIFIFYR